MLLKYKGSVSPSGSAFSFVPLDVLFNFSAISFIFYIMSHLMGLGLSLFSWCVKTNICSSCGVTCCDACKCCVVVKSAQAYLVLQTFILCDTSEFPEYFKFMVDFSIKKMLDLPIGINLGQCACVSPASNVCNMQHIIIFHTCLLCIAWQNFVYLVYFT